MNMREQFESRFKDEYGMAKDSLNQYINADTAAAWDGWQAARTQGDGEAVATCACGDQYPDWKCPNCEAADSEPPAPAQGVPEGVALVPESMCLSYEDIELIVTMTGWDQGRDDFGEGVLWVGTLKDDDGNETYGLHISCIEVMEEGALPVQEFKKPQLSTTPGNGWVRCEDRLPPVFQQCLGWNATANTVNKANTYRLFTAALENTCDITHWMPLPEPPKGGQAE